MNNLLRSGCLFFFEGLLLYRFTPQNFLAEKSSVFNASIYISAYFLALIWVWFADKTRKLGKVLICCMILSFCLRHCALIYIDCNNSVLVKFLYIFSTSMIIPLTCAFTMMQLSPIKQRERFSLQYTWLIMGRLVRICAVDAFLDLFHHEIILKSLLELILVLLFCCIAHKITPDTIQKAKQSLLGSPSKPVRVFTPISKLLGQYRYLLFLLAVLGSSVFFFYMKQKTNHQLVAFSITPLMVLSCEILACLFSYFLVPHRIYPEIFFILGQFLIVTLNFLFNCTPLKFENVGSIFQIILSIGFTITSMANAQIIAIHAKPGLEFTTCALVEIFKNGIAPVIILFFK